MLRNPIIASLDGLSKEETIAAIKELWGNGNRRVWGFKIDTLLLTEGVDVLDELQKKAEAGNLVIDLPIIGTPDLIRRSVQLLSHSTVSHIVCNAMAGPSAIREAIKAASISKILVGSVLSSFDIADIKFIFGHVYREVPSYEFAELAKNTKAAGFFCATEELDFLSRKPESRDILKMVVGVRPESYLDKGEHNFTLTPNQAMERKARYLVIGGPITDLEHWDDPKPKSMAEAAEKILTEIDPRLLSLSSDSA